MTSLNCAAVPKKFLKGDDQLLFEFVNKVLLLRSEKCTIASASDLFLMETLTKLDEINIPGIMLEHMYKILTVKYGRHGLDYDYLLNCVFAHFDIKLGKGVAGTIKQAFSLNNLIECECIKGWIGNKAKSQVSNILVQQGHLKGYLEEMTVVLEQRDIEISILKAILQ